MAHQMAGLDEPPTGRVDPLLISHTWKERVSYLGLSHAGRVLHKGNDPVGGNHAGSWCDKVIAKLSASSNILTDNGFQSVRPSRSRSWARFANSPTATTIPPMREMRKVISMAVQLIAPPLQRLLNDLLRLSFPFGSAQPKNVLRRFSPSSVQPYSAMSNSVLASKPLSSQAISRSAREPADGFVSPN